MPASDFHNAPHYAEGTPNMSGGIPAVLYPSKAVVPLSSGRNIRVELRGDQGGKTINAPQDITINTPDADSFRKSRQQLAAEMAMAGQQALNTNT